MSIKRRRSAVVVCAFHCFHFEMRSMARMQLLKKDVSLVMLISLPVQFSLPWRRVDTTHMIKIGFLALVENFVLRSKKERAPKERAAAEMRASMSTSSFG